MINLNVAGDRQVSPRQMLWFNLLFSALGSLSPLGMDSYLPAVPSIAADFSATEAAVSWTLSYYLIGLAIGQLGGGPLSDQLGRKGIALTGLSLFALSSLAMIFATSLSLAYGFRFFQGLGGGITMVAAIAMVKDTTDSERLATRMSQIVFVLMFMPIAAPIVGSLMLSLGWKSIFWLSVIAASTLLVVLFNVEETHTKRTGRASMSGIIWQYRYVVTHQINGVHVALLQAISQAFSSGIMMIFVTVAPLLIMDYYGYSASLFPYFFGSLIIAILSGNRLGKHLYKSHSPSHVFRAGLICQLCSMVVLLLLALTTSVPIWVTLALLMLAVACSGMIGPAGTSLFLNALDHSHGSATAFESTMRFGFGGLLGGIVASINADLIVVMSSVMLCSLFISAIAFFRAWQYWKLQPAVFSVKSKGA